MQFIDKVVDVFVIRQKNVSVVQVVQRKPWNSHRFNSSSWVHIESAGSVGVFASKRSEEAQGAIESKRATVGLRSCGGHF